jgi:hypothetical protein
VQRDKKLVSYDIVDREGKPYVSVDVAGKNKVGAGKVVVAGAAAASPLTPGSRAGHRQREGSPFPRCTHHTQLG